MRDVSPTSRDFRFAFCAMCFALLVGYLTYDVSIRRLPAPEVPAAQQPVSDVLFDPVTGVNRMFQPTAAEDLSASARIQSRTHRVILVVSFGVVAACILARSIGRRESAARHAQALNVIFWLCNAASAMLLIYLRQASLFQIGVGIGLSGLLYIASGRFSRRLPNRVFGVIACVLIAIWYGPGLLVKVDVSADPWWKNELAEKHLILTISQGDRLAQGAKLYDDIYPSYAGLLAVAKTGIVRFAGPTSALTDTVLVEAVQLLFTALAAWCFYLYSGRRWSIALVALVFLASANSFATWTFYHAPNHTAWRTICYPIALLGVVLSQRVRPTRESATLGLIAGFSLLQNFETGMAISAGLCWYLFCKHGLGDGGWKPKSTFVAAACFALGAAGAIAVHAGLCVLILGYVPNYPALVRQIAQVMRVVSTGHGGGSFQSLDALALLILAHAAYVFIAGSLRALRTRGGMRGEPRIAAAVMILVWFSYYFNRPDIFYLYSFYVAYGVLLIDLIRILVAARRGSSTLRATAVIAAFALSVVVVPRTLDHFATRRPEYSDGLRRISRREPPPKAVAVSGWYLPDDEYAHELLSKAEFIRQTAQRDGSVVYLTENPYFIPKLSGVWSDLPIAEPFWESANPERFDELVRSIVASKHSEIYFDAPAPTGSAAAPHTTFNSSRFFGHLKRALADDFERVEAVSGWERWRRKK